MIAIIDYGCGNLFSIGQALRHLRAPYEITAEAARITAADRVILPGVGAFGDAAAELRRRGLIDVIRAVAARGTPLLGICVGMQLLADASEEFGPHEGLGLIPGTVRRLPEGDDGPEAIRIPNVGWRALMARPDDPYIGDLAPGTMAYFVHSYAPIPADPGHVTATIAINGTEVAAVIRRDNVVGYQFHPEKSGAAGLGLFGRFLALHTEARAMPAEASGR